MAWWISQVHVVILSESYPDFEIAICVYLLQPLITLESSISYVFTVEGMNTVTVQVSAGNTLIQDTKEIAVHGTLILSQSHLGGV